MKSKKSSNLLLFLLAVTALSALPARAQQSALSIGILPEQKSPIIIPESERNPFAVRAEQQVQEYYDKESEESRIRRIFANLDVNGVSEGNNGSIKVLVGDLILEKGKLVPKLLQGQTELIIVSDVSEAQAELAWLDKRSSRYDGRKLIIPINMEPSVEFVLKGQPGDSNAKTRDIQTYSQTISAREGVVSLPSIGDGLRGGKK